MKIHDVEQLSPEWFAVRRGIPTSSHFGEILTQKTRKFSASSSKYADKLLAEWLIGESITVDASGFMGRGTEMEAEARTWFEFTRDVDVEQVGFVTNDAGTVGCSPDGLIGADGGLEIKCPSAHIMVSRMLTPDTDYELQVQGNLMVTERRVWTRLYYHPTLPSVVMRFQRDEELIGQLGAALATFNARLEEKRSRLLAMGCVPAGAE